MQNPDFMILSPWNLDGERSKEKMVKTIKCCEVLKKNYHTLALRSKVEPRKSKNPEDSHLHFKMSNNLVVFRVTTTNKVIRNRTVQKQEVPSNIGQLGS